MLEITEQERLLWVAGLLDGEGYFGVIKPSKGRLMGKVAILCGMTDEDTIKRLHEWAGVGKVTGPFHKDGHKALWKWSARRKAEVEVLAKKLYPYMSKRRQARIEEILIFCKANPMWGGKTADLDPEIKAAFQALCEKTITRLNSSNERLGKALGITGATISRWRNGIALPKSNKIRFWTNKLESLAA